MEATEETTQTQQNKDSEATNNSTKETRENSDESRGSTSPVEGEVEASNTHRKGKTFWAKPEIKNLTKDDKRGNRDSWPSLEEAIIEAVTPATSSPSSASSITPSTSNSSPSSPSDSANPLPAPSTSLLSTPPSSAPTSATFQTNASSTNSSSSSANKRGKKGMNWVPFKDIGPPPSSHFKHSQTQNQNHQNNPNSSGHNNSGRRRNNRDFNSDRTDRGEKGERVDKGDRPERGERGERAERGERGERGERNDRGDRGERGERGAERGDRGDRHGERNYRNNNNFRHGRTRGRGYSNHYNNRQQNIQYPSNSGRIPLFTPQYFPKEDLRELITKQIEYYFSVENLCHDIWLRQQMDEEGWVAVSLIAQFPRILQLSAEFPLIVESIKSSQILELKDEKFRLNKDWQAWVIPKASILLNTPLAPTSTSAEKVVDSSQQEVDTTVASSA